MKAIRSCAGVHIIWLVAFLAVCFSSSAHSTAQTNEWAWIGGDLTYGSQATHGTLGVPDAGNSPGARVLSATWTDNTGKLWLFGGESNGDYYNDLWVFDPSSSLWTFMGGGGAGVYGTKGVPAPGNVPSRRESSATWVDGNGNLWLFGGVAQDFTGTGFLEYFDDLWEYNTTAHQWTWVGGSSTPDQAGVYGTLGVSAANNMPGGRAAAVSWMDSGGKLWLFGGYGYDSTGSQGALNDLWEFDSSMGKWMWVNGPNTTNQPGIPGTFRVPAQTNVPAGGVRAIGWTDKKGRLWLFGAALNDLWVFDPSLGEWAWMSGQVTGGGANNQGVPGVYGTFQVADTLNTPGSRAGTVNWTDKDGNLWLFGGVGPDSTGETNSLNDLWQFNPQTNLWTWMGGSSLAKGFCPLVANWCGQPSVYGPQGQPGLGLTPSGRMSMVSWTDTQGNFWLYGGQGIDSQGFNGFLSDLWEFQPSTGSSIAAMPTLSLQGGTYSSWQTLTISDDTPGATIYYLIDAKIPAAVYSVPLTVTASESIQAIASASGYANSKIASATYKLNIPIASAPVFSVPTGYYTGTQMLTISDSTPGASIYVAIGGVPSATFNAYSGPISVKSSERIQAYAVASDFLQSDTATAYYTIGSIPTPSRWTWMSGSSQLASQCYSTPESIVSCAHPGWYGVLGTPSAGNVPGGRNAAVGWTDTGGNLWLFGGVGYGQSGVLGLLNDLWKFNPSTNLWTWMAGSSYIGDSCQSQAAMGYCGKAGVYGSLGVPSASNTPGGRKWATSWTDSSGHFWLFGGYGFDASGTAGILNDLWEYDPATNRWTWMKGSSNVPGLFGGQMSIQGQLGKPAPENTPGGRYYTVSWSDSSGYLWLYSGLGMDPYGIEGYPGDLWRYEISTNQWTWVNGSPSAGGSNPLYGPFRSPSPFATPGARAYPEGWTDSTGHLWLFGGYTMYDLVGDSYTEDDMWEFDPSAAEWIWIGNGGGAPVRGVQGIPDPDNVPGYCATCASWTDRQGNFWMYAPVISNFGQSGPTERDMWWFSPTTVEWTWMGGITATQGIYGLPGIPAAGNSPAARNFSVSWTGKDGNLWMFGGGGLDANAGAGVLNDLWQYGLSGASPVQPPATAAVPVLSLASGTYSSTQSLTISDQTPGAKIYYTTDGSTPSSMSAVYSSAVSINGSMTVQAVAVADGFVNSPAASASYTLTLPAAAAPTFSPAAGTYSSAQSITLSDSTAGSVIYYTLDGSTPSGTSPSYSSPIAVSTSTTIKAIAMASGFASSSVATASYVINLPPTFTLVASPTSLNLVSGSNGTVKLTLTPQNGFGGSVNFACSGLPGGASCSFSPPTVTLSNASAITQLTIATSTQSALIRNRPGSLLIASVLAFAFLFRRSRLGFSMLVAVALACVGAALVSGCGAGGISNTSRAPVNAIVTVTANSGSVQQSTTLQLTVN